MNNLKTYLTEAYAIDNKSILRILTQNKQINKSDPDYNYYEKLANWANSSGKQQKLKNIDLNTIKLTDRGLLEKRKLITRYTTLGHLLLALKNLMDQEGKYTPSSELSRVIQLTTLEILAGLSGIKATKEPPEEPDDTDTPELYEGMDWTAEKARRLANAKEAVSSVLDKFYNDYYHVEYAGGTDGTNGEAIIVDKLKSLDKILIPEFNALGYNPEVNPLAQFLKILIGLRKTNSIFNKLTPNTYGAIHNSFKANHITGNMLGNYNENHILFCEDLYNYKGLDIVKYLELYKATLGKAEDAKVEPKQDKWTLATKVFIQQDLSGAETTRIKFTDKVTMLLNKQNVLIPTADKAKLRSFAEVEELYTYLFKAAPGHKEQEENNSLKNIVNIAKEKNVLLAMIYYIVNNNAFKKEYPKDAANIVLQLKDLDYSPSTQGLETSKQILSLFDKDISVKDLRALIQKLISTYKANKKKAGK